MTSIVGIRCTDGVVIGTDSAATFGDGSLRTIEQPTNRKIEIIGDKVIVAGTGYVGHHQRFAAKVKKLWDDNSFRDLDPLEFAKKLAQAGLEEFHATRPHVLQYAALVAFQATKNKEPALCELPQGSMHPGIQVPGPAFQPELKDPKDHLWFASAGSGQPITDPFLALFRGIFWKDGPPDLRGGKFTAMWALKHACEVNPGGIKEPVKMAVLEAGKNGYAARMLSDDDLAEVENIVSDASAHFGRFKNILRGEANAAEVPKP